MILDHNILNYIKFWFNDIFASLYFLRTIKPEIVPMDYDFYDPERVPAYYPVLYPVSYLRINLQHPYIAAGVVLLQEL